ncbi:MAG: translesion DNA synthesis-associated protein ImuA [Rhodocyclaceae bacterium]
MPALALTCLTDILQRADIWRGDRLAVLDGQAVASGLPALDAELPGGGWPRGALVELLADAQAIGELSLLLPALRTTVTEAPIALIAPPGLAHAPAWAAQLPLGQLLWVEAPAEHIAWSTEQLLGSGALGAVLAWLPDKMDNRSMRRLQLAAEGCRSLAFMFRAPSCARTPSPAPLRLSLAGTAEGLRVTLLKRRGPPCANPLLLQIERPLPWARPARAPRPAPVHEVVRLAAVDGPAKVRS